MNPSLPAFRWATHLPLCWTSRSPIDFAWSQARRGADHGRRDAGVDNGRVLNTAGGAKSGVTDSHPCRRHQHNDLRRGQGLLEHNSSAIHRWTTPRWTNTPKLSPHTARKFSTHARECEPLHGCALGFRSDCLADNSSGAENDWMSEPLPICTLQCQCDRHISETAAHDPSATHVVG